MIQILKAAALYFGIVFAVGFALGTIRVLWVAPHFGVRAAELIEAPFMLIATFLAARWTTRRLVPPNTVWTRLQVGVIALAILLAVEFTLVLWVRGLSFPEYLESRDPVSGAVYLLLLAVFAVMPAPLRPATKAS
ncbi:MAG: hypothetical protein ACSLFJ_07605 [Immundisolibacter sp.]|uniref:hypothetical protein n=1 Tax=Immundisolibacter sp. TaxID=1934948 RepID=UPI003EDFFB47